MDTAVFEVKVQLEEEEPTNKNSVEQLKLDDWPIRSVAASKVAMT